MPLEEKNVLITVQHMVDEKKKLSDCEAVSAKYVKQEGVPPMWEVKWQPTDKSKPEFSQTYREDFIRSLSLKYDPGTLPRHRKKFREGPADLEEKVRRDHGSAAKAYQQDLPEREYDSVTVIMRDAEIKYLQEKKVKNADDLARLQELEAERMAAVRDRSASVSVAPSATTSSRPSCSTSALLTGMGGNMPAPPFSPMGLSAPAASQPRGEKGATEEGNLDNAATAEPKTPEQRYEELNEMFKNGKKLSLEESKELVGLRKELGSISSKPPPMPEDPGSGKKFGK